MNSVCIKWPWLVSVIAWSQTPIRWIEYGQAWALLAARLYVGQVFFRSGWLSVQDWAGTLSLYEDDFHVPLLPPHLAAYLGTTGEIGLPLLLFIGLSGRLGALGLFVVNLIAYVSVTDLAPAAVLQHCWWGSLLLALILWGPGSLSADHWILRCLGPRQTSTIGGVKI